MGPGCERNRVRLVAVLVACLLFSTVFYGCGGGGGGGGAVVATPQYGSIEGYVYAPMGSGARVAEATPAGKKAVQGATVSVKCGTTEKNSTTNSSGYFKITSLPAGNCSLTVTYTGFESYFTKIKIKANSTSTVGGSSDISLSLATSGSITVTANVSGGTVFIDGEDTGVPIPASLSHTFDGIAPGAHTVSITQSGLEGGDAQSVDVVETDTTAVSFTMNPSGNQAPVADAGRDFKGFAGTKYIDEGWNGTQSVFTPTDISIELDGSTSTDPDGDSLQYAWTQLSGTAVTLSNSDNATASFIPEQEGEYVFQLIVSDGFLRSVPDTVAVNIAKPNGKLTFYISAGLDNSDGEIFSMNADGSNFIQITDNYSLDSHPSWSPTGNQISYAEEYAENTFMALINSDGTGHLTTAIPYGASDWFDSDEVLAYKYYSGSLDFYRINIDGTGEQRLTFTGTAGAFARISPDGSRIAFKKSYSGDNYEIVVMNSDGSNLTRLTDNNSTIELFFTWLPDNRIVYTTHNYVGDTVRGLYVMDADGTNVTEIPLPSSVFDIHSNLTSSADGRFIFFGDHNYYLHVMYSDGSASMSYGVTGQVPDYHPGP